MKTRLRIGLTVLPLLVVAATANRAGAPAFNTGAPGEGTCMACHSSNSLNDASGLLVIEAPSAYTPGASTDLLVRVERASSKRFGFQITAKDAAGNHVGTFNTSAPGIRLTDTSTDHVTHDPAADATGSFEWTIPWEGPPTGAGEVTFYAAANAANGDFGTFGDFIFTTSLAVAEGSAVAVDRPAEMPSRLNVSAAYPNPAASQSVSIPYESGPERHVTLTLHDALGRVVFEMTGAGGTGIFRVDTGALVPGIYLVRVGDGSSAKTTSLQVIR